MTPHELPNYAPEIKRALGDVRHVCDALGLTSNPRTFTKQARGFIVLCPWHEERSPSCSVRVAQDGTISVKCFGCDRGGDVLDLVAAVRGMSTSGTAFRDVLAEGARLGGLWQIVDAIEGRTPREKAPAAAPAPPPPEPEPRRDWPPQHEVQAVWQACKGAADYPLVADKLAGRKIDPERVQDMDLARALPIEARLPRWARCRGGSWSEAGYLIIVPMYAPDGAMRSLRAWRVVGGEGPKRLPPFGHKASGLCMLDGFALAAIGGGRAVQRVVIVEGEPDFLARAMVSNDPRLATYGIVSGSWNDAWSATVPSGAPVLLRTDADVAGNRYAIDVERSIASSRFGCTFSRLVEAPS